MEVLDYIFFVALFYYALLYKVVVLDKKFSICVTI